MRKIPYQRAAIYIGLSIVSSAGVTHADAAKPQSSNTATKSAQVDRTSSPKNPHLLELEKRLGQVILASQPDTKIEFTTANYLGAYYRSEKQATHPTDSSNFQLRLRVEEDVMYYRPENVPRYTPQPFGTTFSNRYNLGVLARPTSDSWPSEVPREHWAYNEYDRLSKIGLLPDRFPGGFWSGPYVGMMTRNQLAFVTARLTDEFETNAQTAKDNPDAKNALTALQKEFAPEFNALGFHLDTNKSVVNGQTWRPRYEYLSLYFSYSEGIDTTLPAKINQIIADYANSIMKSTTSTSNVSAQK